MYEQPRAYDVYFDPREQKITIYLSNDYVTMPTCVEVRTMDNSYSSIYTPISGRYPYNEKET